jgi:hypothetical protein
VPQRGSFRDPRGAIFLQGSLVSAWFSTNAPCWIRTNDRLLRRLWLQRPRAFAVTAVLCRAALGVRRNVRRFGVSRALGARQRGSGHRAAACKAAARWSKRGNARARCSLLMGRAVSLNKPTAYSRLVGVPRGAQCHWGLSAVQCGQVLRTPQGSGRRRPSFNVPRLRRGVYRPAAAALRSRAGDGRW